MHLGGLGRRPLVTGGSGFIGRHLLDRLARSGVTIVCADLKPPPDNIPTLEFSKLDIRDPERVSHAMRGTDLVVHLASGNFATSLKEPVLDYEIGVDGTLNVLEAARKNDVDRIVYASSYLVYGHVRDVPVREDVPCAPISPYGVSKLAGENYCRLYSETHGMTTVCLRFTNVYGPHQEMGYLIPNLIASIRSGREIDVFGDGKQTRDFIYIEDVVEAILRSCSTKVKHLVLNVGSGRETSVLELAEVISEELGRSPRIIFHPPREGEMRRFAADISRMMKELDYAPAFELREGIRRTIPHYTGP